MRPTGRRKCRRARMAIAGRPSRIRACAAHVSRLRSGTMCRLCATDRKSEVSASQDGDSRRKGRAVCPSCCARRSLASASCLRQHFSRPVSRGGQRNPPCGSRVARGADPAMAAPDILSSRGSACRMHACRPSRTDVGRRSLVLRVRYYRRPPSSAACSLRAVPCCRRCRSSSSMRSLEICAHGRKTSSVSAR